jgi:hypothetical protein
MYKRQFIFELKKTMNKYHHIISTRETVAGFLRDASEEILMKARVWLMAGWMAMGLFLPSGISAEETEREVTVRKIVPQVEETAPQETPESEEAAAYRKQKAFIEELRTDAETFRANFDTLTEEGEKQKATEDFRASRTEKIKAFLATQPPKPNAQDSIPPPASEELFNQTASKGGH